METDVLIVGGGPAGLNAAYEVASKGIKTVIVDESFSFGGQLRQQTQLFHNLPKQFDRQRGTNLLNTLIQRLDSLPVSLLSNHTMIGKYKDGDIGISDGEKIFPIKANKVIVTTGAAEEPCMFEGWTLPGVMTIGAAQILINRERVLPGRNAIILGYTSFSLEVARQLKACGVNILGIVEKENALEHHLGENLQQDIPVFFNTHVTRAGGRGEVESVLINQQGMEDEWKVDLICTANGFSPILETFEVLDCSFTYKEKLGGLIPKYDCTFKTESPSIYAAGNAAGVTCMGSLLVTAEIVAIHVLGQLEKLGHEEVLKQSEWLWKELLHIETKSDRDVFDARVESIMEYHKEKNVWLPPSFHTILEEY